MPWCGSGVVEVDSALAAAEGALLLAIKVDIEAVLLAASDAAPSKRLGCSTCATHATKRGQLRVATVQDSSGVGQGGHIPRVGGEHVRIAIGSTKFSTTATSQGTRLIGWFKTSRRTRRPANIHAAAGEFGGISSRQYAQTRFGAFYSVAWTHMVIEQSAR